MIVCQKHERQLSINAFSMHLLPSHAQNAIMGSALSQLLQNDPNQLHRIDEYVQVCCIVC